MLPDMAYASNTVAGKQEVILQVSEYICTSNECATALFQCENFADNPTWCLQKMGKAHCIQCIMD